MNFENNTIYHIYNQGNNRNNIFFRRENYIYFLDKMSKYILPFGDILSYCLMPNHFHWLVSVKNTEILFRKNPEKIRMLNDSIGILLRSYTRAIHKQEGTSGALFRAKTKAKDGLIDGIITLEGANKHLFFRDDNDYIRQCIVYIHNNPVKAGLVSSPEEWEFSSYRDFVDINTNSICNIELARSFFEA